MAAQPSGEITAYIDNASIKRLCASCAHGPTTAALTNNGRHGAGLEIDHLGLTASNKPRLQLLAGRGKRVTADSVDKRMQCEAIPLRIAHHAQGEPSHWPAPARSCMPRVPGRWAGSVAQ